MMPYLYNLFLLVGHVEFFKPVLHSSAKKMIRKLRSCGIIKSAGEQFDTGWPLFLILAEEGGKDKAEQRAGRSEHKQ